MYKEEIEVKEIWNNDKKEELKKFISKQSELQMDERLLRNKLLSIQYKIEDYISNDNDSLEVLKILDFVKLYLKAFNITKKSLASYFEIEDSNLHKYLSGERKLNAELAMKLSSFSRTNPEYWFRIQIKNELIKFRSEKKGLDFKSKYDYKNLVDV